MAIVTIPGLMIPEPPSASTAPAYVGSVLDAAGEKHAVVLQAPKTGSIRKIHFRTGTTATPTDTDVRIETVDLATGDPTGTLWGTNTNVTVASASLTSSTWIITGNLTADAAVTQGDLLAVVIVPSGSPNYQLTYMTAGNANLALPYLDQFLASAWGKLGGNPLIALEYSDGSFGYIPFVNPGSAIVTHTFNNGSTPDEIALYFRLPISVRIKGVWLWADRDGDCDIVMYDSNGTSVMESYSLDKEVRGSALSRAPQSVLFVDPPIPLANTFYRMAIKPTSATSLTTYSFDFNSAALLDQMAGGQDFHYSSRVDAGGWTQLATRRLFLGLIIDGVDSGGGTEGMGIRGSGQLAGPVLVT